MRKIPVCMGRYFLELPPWNHISLMSLFACWDNLCTYWVLSLCVSVNEERKLYKCVHDDWYQNEIYIFSSIEKYSRWILFPPVLFLFSGFYFSSNYEYHILGIMCYSHNIFLFFTLLSLVVLGSSYWILCFVPYSISVHHRAICNSTRCYILGFMCFLLTSFCCSQGYL